MDYGDGRIVNNNNNGNRAIMASKFSISKRISVHVLMRKSEDMKGLLESKFCSQGLVI